MTTPTADNYKLELDLKKSLFEKKKHISIAKNYIEYGGKRMEFKDIAAIRYGSIQYYHYGIKGNKTFEINLKDKSGKILKIIFMSLIASKNKMDDSYSLIISSLWFAVTSNFVNKHLDELEKGHKIKVAGCELTPHGIGFETGLFIKKTHFLEWKNARMVGDKGFLVISSGEKKSIKKRIPFLRTWDAVVLYSLLNWLWKDGNAFRLSEQHKK